MGRSVFIVSVLVVMLSGCAQMKEGFRGFLGISTKELERGRTDAIEATFQCEPSACYEKVLGILKEIGAYVYARDNNKKMVAVYVSAADTTPVGIFLTATDTMATKVQVSSPSTYAKELIAEKIFAALKKQLNPVK